MTSPYISDLGGADPTRVIARRIVAAFVDSMLQVMVLGAALLLMGTSAADLSNVAGGAATQLSAYEAGQVLLATVFSLLFLLLNRVIFVAVYGWTLGKLFVGLRCVNALGRPPGLSWALVRGIVMYLFEGIGGVLGSGILLMSILATKGHRSIADLAARTFVIDASYEGRLIILGETKAVAGPESITRDEATDLGFDVEDVEPEPVAGVAVAAESAPPEAPPGVKGEPTYDSSLRTYVVYDSATGKWLKQRRTTGEWVAMEGF